MALTLDINPTHYQLAKNLIPVKVTSDSYISVAGVAAAAGVTVDAVGVGTTGSLTFTFNGNTVVVNMAAALDDSGLILRDNHTSLSTVAYTLQAVADLKLNYLLFSNYYIAAFGSEIGFIARQTGSDWDLTIVSTVTNLTVATPAGGVDEVLQENIKLLCDVYVEDVLNSGLFNKIVGFELDPDEDGAATFYIQSALRSRTGIDFPDYGLTAPVKCINNNKRYYVKYAEKYGDPVEVKRYYLGDTGRVIRGGVSNLHFPDSSSYFDQLIARFFGLSWQPDPKIKEGNTVDTQEFLMVIVPPGVTELHIQATVWYTDGTDDSIDNVNTTAGMADYEIWCWATGFNALALGDLEPTKTPLKYRLAFIDQATNNQANTVMYYIDQKSELEDKTFLFVNSLGGVDTVRCTGIATDGFKIERNIAERVLGYDFVATQGALFQSYARKQTINQQSTGWKTKEEIDWLEELFISEYVVLDDGTQWIPLIINKNTVQKYKSKDNLFALVFEYVYAWTDEVYSQAIVLENFEL